MGSRGVWTRTPPSQRFIIVLRWAVWNQFLLDGRSTKSIGTIISSLSLAFVRGCGKRRRQSWIGRMTSNGWYHCSGRQREWPSGTMGTGRIPSVTEEIWPEKGCLWRSSYKLGADIGFQLPWDAKSRSMSQVQNLLSRSLEGLGIGGWFFIWGPSSGSSLSGLVRRTCKLVLWESKKWSRPGRN